MVTWINLSQRQKVALEMAYVFSGSIDGFCVEAPLKASTTLSLVKVGLLERRWRMGWEIKLTDTGRSMVETYSKSLDVQRATPPEAPRGGTAAAGVLVSKRNSYDVDDMIGALLKIAETLNLEHVSTTQIAESVATLQAELAAARKRERVLREALEAITRLSPYSTSYYAMDQYRNLVQDTAKDALQAAQAQQPGRADGYAVGQEVILLDGTSLIGQVIEKGYKVSLDGSEGRWYSADELAAYVAGKAQDTASE